MDLLVTVNRSYLHPLAVMLKSVVQQPPGRDIRVFVLHRSLVPADLDRVARAVDAPDLELVGIRADDRLFAGAPTTGRYPCEIYDRIFAARYLPKDLDRVLYLDPDLVAIRPLDELWATPMGDCFFAAASHVNRSLEKFNALRLQSRTPGPYINSGVLLMNLERLRREQELQPVLDYVEEHRSALLLPDQDIISALYGDRIHLLDPMRYNMTERLLTFSRLTPGSQIDLDWVCSHTAIVHYCGRNKPWKPGYTGQLGEFYEAYDGLIHAEALEEGSPDPQ